jgi:hypothetical protein
MREWRWSAPSASCVNVRRVSNWDLLRAVYVPVLLGVTLLPAWLGGQPAFPNRDVGQLHPIVVMGVHSRRLQRFFAALRVTTPILFYEAAPP